MLETTTLNHNFHFFLSCSFWLVFDLKFQFPDMSNRANCQPVMWCWYLFSTGQVLPFWNRSTLECPSSSCRTQRGVCSSDQPWAWTCGAVRRLRGEFDTVGHLEGDNLRLGSRFRSESIIFCARSRELSGTAVRGVSIGGSHLRGVTEVRVRLVSG